jgi:hypothetical protein
LGCIILLPRRLRHQIYQYHHDVYQDACKVKSLAHFLAVSTEAVPALVDAPFDDESDEGQEGASTRLRNNKQALRQSVVTTRISGGRSGGTSTTSSRRKSTRPSTDAIPSWKRRPHSTWKRTQCRVRRRDAPSRDGEWGLHESVKTSTRVNRACARHSPHDDPKYWICSHCRHPWLLKTPTCARCGTARPEGVNDLAIDEESIHGKNAKITKFIDGLTNPAPNEERRALPQGQLGPRSTADPEAKRIEPSRTRLTTEMREQET